MHRRLHYLSWMSRPQMWPCWLRTADGLTASQPHILFHDFTHAFVPFANHSRAAQPIAPTDRTTSASSNDLRFLLTLAEDLADVFTAYRTHWRDKAVLQRWKMKRHGQGLSGLDHALADTASQAVMNEGIMRGALAPAGHHQHLLRCYSTRPSRHLRITRPHHDVHVRIGEIFPLPLPQSSKVKRTPTTRSHLIGGLHVLHLHVPIKRSVL
ncbi:hypothetical protein EJ04DRAFT_156972 [Polyplosphaeria fusca]|uniref:Uncharacterized protein n=1 Tax=Polyplosphaeria fusca TaxID=682080 RepID=A0A9P4R4F3_9PLEO|nr:hypothetical protein EJ04DRAFT_156972 [Polyplosphaeria fusca]